MIAGILVGPRELAAIDDDAADGRAVAAQKLGGRMDHDVRAVLDRPAQVRRRHRVVHDQWHAGIVRDLGHCSDIQNVHPRVGDGLAVHGARFRGDRFAEIFRIVWLDELDVDSHAPEADIELRIRPAVERAGRYQFVARAEQTGDRQELRRLSAGRRQTRHAAFQRRYALFEDVRGGIHDPRINVPELLQSEQRRGVVRVLKSEGSSLVNRDCARAARRVRSMTGVQGFRGEPEFAGRSIIVSHSYRIPREGECSILNSVISYWGAKINISDTCSPDPAWVRRITIRCHLPGRGTGKSLKILIYNPDNGVTQNFMPHLWMFLLQSLTPAGNEVVLIDGNTHPMTDPELVQYALDQKIGLVGIGAMTRMIAKAYRVADALRAAGVPVVMGGPHVTECPDEALGRDGGPRHADAIALGEADETWPRIVADAARGAAQGSLHSR